MLDFESIESEEKPFADRLAYYIKFMLNPTQVIDVGCGPGHFVKSLRSLGVNALGVDIDPRVEGIPYLFNMNLLDSPFKGDLCLCIEVFEHIDAIYENRIVQKLFDSFTDTLIFTAAQPGQGGDGHINCQFPEYWSDKFCALGAKRNYLAEDMLRLYCLQGVYMGWFYNNILVFNKEKI